jgi:hypothetical protein
MVTTADKLEEDAIYPDSWRGRDFACFPATTERAAGRTRV